MADGHGRFDEAVPERAAHGPIPGFGGVGAAEWVRRVQARLYPFEIQSTGSGVKIKPDFLNIGFPHRDAKIRRNNFTFSVAVGVRTSVFGIQALAKEV
jgi:hypothetical protein